GARPASPCRSDGSFPRHARRPVTRRVTSGTETPGWRGPQTDRPGESHSHPSVSLVRAEFVCVAGLADAQCFVGWEELVPAGLDVAELAAADVVGHMLDVNLDPRAVGREQVDRHAPLF